MTTRMRAGLLISTTALAVAITFVAMPKGTASADATAPTAAAPQQAHPLLGVGAIVEFDIASAQYTYDDVMGPRATFALANVKVHAGTVSNLTTISQSGGPLPNGNMARLSELPVLTPGSRYIAFLSANSWFATPVWRFLAFRVETIGSRSVIVGPNGRPVTSFTADGITFAKTIVVDLSEPNDPMTARPRIANISEKDPDVVSALDHDSFVSAAVQTATSVGAPLNALTPTVPRLPVGMTQWNIIQGSPQVGP